MSYREIVRSFLEKLEEQEEQVYKEIIIGLYKNWLQSTMPDLETGEILKKYEADVLKMFFLSSHYRSPVDYTDEKMQECKTALEKFHILFERIVGAPLVGALNRVRATTRVAPTLDDFRNKFVEAMDDDFNTAKALAVLFDLTNYANKLIDDKKNASGAKKMLQELGGVLGLFQSGKKKIDVDFKKEIDALVKKRNDARENKDFKLADQMKQRADTLSGGQKQRLGLAAATLHKPRMLFLDEPTSAVDPQNRRDFWEKLFELAELGTTILVSTHYMDEAERCHKLAILDEGVKVADGTPKDLGNSITSNVFEVTATDPNAARSSLAAQQGIISITQLGIRLRVLVPKELSNALSLVQENLSVANIEADVQQVFPDLEDVFVSVTELRRREGLAA